MLLLRLALSGFLVSSAAVRQAPNASSLATEFTRKAHSSVSRTQAAQLPKGQIIEKVVCADIAAQSYALYLPSNYSPARQWPILYAFDPGARGKVPLEHFKEAAEKYGWIVVGSNNSRNGPIQSATEAWKAMWADTHERFAIDQERIYTGGFSGASRVAVLFASLCGDCIAGVIGGGAGFPEGVAPAATMHFAFFGTLGVDDFNYPEVKSLADVLAKVGIAHYVRVYPGRHEWAPAPVTTEAVEWMELQAMKSGRRQRNEELIEELWRKYYESGKALENSGDPYHAYLVFAGLIESFKGLHDTSEAAKHAADLRDSRAVKDGMREERQQISRQRDSERQIYTLVAENSGDEAFDAGPRLHALIDALQKTAKAETDTGERRVARRVLEGMFIGHLEQGRNLLQVQKRYDEAARKFELAGAFAPDRPGAFFYLAQACALHGNKKRALQALKTAIDKGFSDPAAITDNKAFDSLRNEAQYRQLMQSLQTAH